MLKEADRSVYPAVRFGRYMQAENETQTNQPVEWITFRKEASRNWLVSRYCLDCYHFHFRDADTDWIHCDLRAWLKEIFLLRAFTAEEQQHLQPMPAGISCFPVQRGTGALQSETCDLVTIMEKGEALAFFHTFDDRKCTTTDYAESILRKRGVHHSTRECSWWLRDGRMKHWKAPAMGRMGMVNMYPVTDPATLVRPVICLTEEKMKSLEITAVPSADAASGSGTEYGGQG